MFKSSRGAIMASSLDPLAGDSAADIHAEGDIDATGSFGYLDLFAPGC